MLTVIRQYFQLSVKVIFSADLFTLNTEITKRSCSFDTSKNIIAHNLKITSTNYWTIWKMERDTFNEFRVLSNWTQAMKEEKNNSTSSHGYSNCNNTLKSQSIFCFVFIANNISAWWSCYVIIPKKSIWKLLSNGKPHQEALLNKNKNFPFAWIEIEMKFSNGGCQTCGQWIETDIWIYISIYTRSVMVDSPAIIIHSCIAN